MKPWVLPIVGVAGLLTGAFVGYVVTERVVRERYDKLLDEEVSNAKRFYKERYSESNQHTVQNNHTPEDGAEETQSSDSVSAFTLTNMERSRSEALRLMTELGYEQGLRESEKNIPEFDETSMTTTDYPIGKMTIDEAQQIDYESDAFAELIAGRQDDVPYVVTVDEFMDERQDFDKLTFAYFEGDDIVVDEREKPFLEVDAVLGSDNLTLFGAWSKDKDVVHIRNVKLKTDFEVTRDERSFGEVVAGFRPEPKNPIRKMRKLEDD